MLIEDQIYQENQLSQENESDIDEAIAVCKKKKYAITHTNVLGEINKIKEAWNIHKLESNKPDQQDPISEVRKREMMRVLNQLFFEFKDELEDLKGFSLVDFQQKIQSNNSVQFIIENFNNLSKLYFDGIITEAEFSEKKIYVLKKSLYE